MAEINTIGYRDISTGDAAVDGLAGGVVGGVLMAVYLEAAGLVMGESLGRMLGRFNPQEGDSLLVAFLLHLAVAGVYGILFGILYRAAVILRKDLLAPLPSAVLGLVYGILLLVLARGVLLPGAGSTLMEIPLLHFGIAHLIFGISAGLLAYQFRLKGAV
jgi:hypothetical protein